MRDISYLDTGRLVATYALFSVGLACASGSARRSDHAGVSAAASHANGVLPERPRPYPVFETPAFARAVEQGTRTRSGRPGPRYWQQWAEYRLAAELDPASRRLMGRGSVRYHNRSPDTLTGIAVHLYQNLHAPGAPRTRDVPVTSGLVLSRLAAQGEELKRVTPDDSAPGYWIDGTVALIQLPTPLLPDEDAELEFAWAFTVPPDGAPRMGTDSEVYYLAYWYPQIAVYDDVSGWHVDSYLANSEFYMGYGDYDVSLTVPDGWLIAATGTLTNPADVLTAHTRARLDSVRHLGEVVHVVSAKGRGAGKATLRRTDGRLTWRFVARNVRDFAWGASDKYLWDATIAVLGDTRETGRADTTSVHTFYRPERAAWAWDQSARYGRHSVEFLSRYLWPYPYPQMTIVDGVTSCSGMEYPMITCIGGPRDTLSLYSVMVHEIGHMWFPMHVGSDEKRYAWQDEGLTRFNQAQAMRDFFNGYDLERIARGRYLDLAHPPVGENLGGEVELMRHGDRYPVETRAYAIASYDKMATILVALRGLVGDDTFLRAYREYGRRWANKHPQPYDLWNTFNDITGRDLGWFWRTWFYETWTLDQAISGVQSAGDSVEITVEDRGLAPMPVRLAVRRNGGSVQRMEIPVEAWLSGTRVHALRLAREPAIDRVEIDPEHAFPDVDRENNVWESRTMVGARPEP